MCEVPWTILRPPAVYGPRDLAFLKLFKMALKGSIPHIRGPRQEISLVHGDDLARGIIEAADSEKTGVSFRANSQSMNTAAPA